MKIAIVDYGMGNLHSVLKSVEAVNSRGASIFLTHSPDEIHAADKVIFPGQGAMPDCMRALNRDGLAEAVREAALTKPFFGICVGAQLLLDHSEEGDTSGLGILRGRVVKFSANTPSGTRRKIPHMGWNRVFQLKPHPIFSGIADGEWFYFVHSFYFQPEHSADISLAESEYPERFSCIIGRENMFATQFHTEKSCRVGLKMMENFLGWDGQA